MQNLASGPWQNITVNPLPSELHEGTVWGQGLTGKMRGDIRENWGTRQKSHTMYVELGCWDQSPPTSSHRQKGWLASRRWSSRQSHQEGGPANSGPLQASKDHFAVLSSHTMLCIRVSGIRNPKLLKRSRQSLGSPELNTLKALWPWINVLASTSLLVWFSNEALHLHLHLC